MNDFGRDVKAVLRKITVEQVQPTMDSIREIESDINSGTFSPVYIQEKLKPRKDEARKAVERAKDQARHEISQLAKQEAERKAEAEMLDWNALPDDATFLRFGFLNADDVLELASRYGDNPVMLRVLRRYADHYGLVVRDGLPLSGYVQDHSEDDREAYRNIAETYMRNHMTTEQALTTLDRLFPE